MTAHRSRILSVSIASAATAGRVTITDGSGGATLFDIDTPASAATPITIYIGEDSGILCQTGIYLGTLTNATAVTVFYTGG